MKNKKLKAKKGMTLIEVIISVTLLSILIVPISGFMLSSLKNNISSQKKQEASYIGQKILEELKAYDYINLKNDNKGYYFELLDGDKIYKDSNSNLSEEKFQAKIDRDIYGKSNDKRALTKYKVDIKIQEDSLFKYEDINNLEINNDADYKIDFINENNINFIKIINNNIQNKKEFSKDIKIDITKDNNQFNLGIYDKNNSEVKIENLKKENKNNKILLYINSNYNTDTNIEINNATEEVIYLYIIKQKGSLANIKATINKGSIVLSEEEEIIKTNIGSMYVFSVVVNDDKDNKLFESKSSSNIQIK